MIIKDLIKKCIECGLDFERKARCHKICSNCTQKRKKKINKLWYLKTRKLSSLPRKEPILSIPCCECKNNFHRRNNTQKVCLDCRKSYYRKYRACYVKDRYQKDLDYRAKCRVSNNKAKRNWILNNPERNRNMIRVYTSKRRAIGVIDLKSVQMVYEDNIKKYGTLTCILCLKKIGFGTDSLEHKLPICRGGTNDFHNLGVSHYKCNISKGRKTVEEYQEYIGAHIG